MYYQYENDDISRDCLRDGPAEGEGVDETAHDDQLLPVHTQQLKQPITLSQKISA